MWCVHVCVCVCVYINNLKNKNYEANNKMTSVVALMLREREIAKQNFIVLSYTSKANQSWADTSRILSISHKNENETSSS